MRPFAFCIALLLLASGAAAFLLANSHEGGSFVEESLPVDHLPHDFYVDTEPVSGVADPVGDAQVLMDAWNAVPNARQVFGAAIADGPYDSTTVGQTFGVFTNDRFEIAFDDDGSLLSHFGIDGNVLGITLKSVDNASGTILDCLVLINTQPGALQAPGTNATREELFESALLHELGHTLGLGHSPVGMVNLTTFGLSLMPPSRIPTMFPFRLPVQPQDGATLERDDEAALLVRYGTDTSGLGSISGTVRAASGAPINQIAVRAVGPDGTVHDVGVLTNRDGTAKGTFRVPYLEPGGYKVLVEAINGRASVDGAALASGTDSLGSNPFVYAIDEYWQPGDTYDPAVDDPTVAATVQVRAGEDTGGVDVVLNATPLHEGDVVNGSLKSGDTRVPDDGGGFHFADYFLFRAEADDALTLEASAGGLTPQLLLLGPKSLGLVSSSLPATGNAASISRTLSSPGIYTVILFAGATTGNAGGTGTYTLRLSGSGSDLPLPPVVTGPLVAAGPASPKALAIGSPVCDTPILQIRMQAPSHEELWVDAMRLNASGTGDDGSDVKKVRLVRDLDGNGKFDPKDPVVAAGTYGADDGSLTFSSLDIRIEPSRFEDYLVVYDVTPPAPPATAGVGGAGALPLGLAALLLCLLLLGFRRRAAAFLFVCALLPLACAGGAGGGSGCNPPFDPAGIVTTYAVRLDAGGLTAFTSTSDPSEPLPLPASPVDSATLRVSR